MAANIENWDQDDDFQGDLFAHSVSTIQTSFSSASFSSRQSIHSESNAGEEDWQVQLNPHDDASIVNAIASAKQAFIPIPENVPSSALLGGSIKRLGKKKSQTKAHDDWEDDLELPSNGSGGLQLKVRQPAEQPTPVTPSQTDDQDDFEWAEGSLGIRFGGTKRENRARSSSISAMSPSMGSCMTMESEDDGLDGLVLPTGAVDFASRLKERQSTAPDAMDSSPLPAEKEMPDRPPSQQREFADSDDFLEGLDVGADGILDQKKLNFNPNVQVNSTRTHMTTSRSATTLTFTDKPGASRIPRPSSKLKVAPRHDPLSRLEPVYESGASQKQRQNRPPTTTSAQLLRSKRSAPVLGNNYRSTTPRQPFRPAGQTSSQASQTASKSSTSHLRRDSDPKRTQSPALRSHSRLGGPFQETPSRAGHRKSMSKEGELVDRFQKRKLHATFGDGSELEAFDDLPTSATKERPYVKTPTLAHPRMKGVAASTSVQQLHQLRHQQSYSKLPGAPDRMATPLPPSTPRSPVKSENTPRFARDTFATRMARQQRIEESSSKPRTGPLQPVSTNWKAQVAAASPQNSPTAAKRRKGTGQKPHLIKNISTAIPKNEKGMSYNPILHRWEGNDHALNRFQTPTPTLRHTGSHAQVAPQRHLHHHSHTHSTPNLRRPSTQGLNANSPPRAAPALISNMGAGGRAVQVEKGMVFDPQRMCWLKLDSGAKRANRKLKYPEAMSLDSASQMEEDEDDPFKGLDDLLDDNENSRPTTAVRASNRGSRPASGFFGAGLSGLSSTQPSTPLIDEPPPICEEFDLGPEFIRRQRDEEANWKARVDAWLPERDSIGDDWRWRIREFSHEFEASKGMGSW